MRKLLGKSKKGYKVSGNRNPLSERFWNKSRKVRRGYLVMKNGSWEDFKERYRKEGKLGEAFEKVAKDEIGRLGIVQEMLRKSTDFLRRIVALVGGMGGVTLSCVSAHIATVFLWRTAFGGCRRHTETATTERRSTAAGGVRCVEANTNGAGGTARYQCQ